MHGQQNIKICIFLVSRQPVLLSVFQNIFIPLWERRVYPAALLKKIYLDLCQTFCIFFCKVQISLPYKIKGRDSALYNNNDIRYLLTAIGFPPDGIKLN